MLPGVVKVSVLLGLVVVGILVFLSNTIKALSAVAYYARGVYFSGSIWFLPVVSTFTFMPLVKVGEALIKSFDQG